MISDLLSAPTCSPSTRRLFTSLENLENRHRCFSDSNFQHIPAVELARTCSAKLTPFLPVIAGGRDISPRSTCFPHTVSKAAIAVLSQVRELICGPFLSAPGLTSATFGPTPSLWITATPAKRSTCLLLSPALGAATGRVYSGRFPGLAVGPTTGTSCSRASDLDPAIALLVAYTHTRVACLGISARQQRNPQPRNPVILAAVRRPQLGRTNLVPSRKLSWRSWLSWLWR